MQNIKEFTKGFEESFGFLEENRQRSKIYHPLIEVVFLTIVAIAGGALSWTMIEAFGQAHISILRQYYPFNYGIPSDDTIRRVFEMLDPQNLNEALMKYFSSDLREEHISIDGKTIRGSKRNGSRALHFLNVYVSSSGLTLYSKNIDAKTNEIKAIPETIDALDIKGAVVTVDAMGCQKDIAQKIMNKDADYIFGLKKNQLTLYNEVEIAFESYPYISFFTIDCATTNEQGHGRFEERRCRVINNLCRIKSSSQWPGMSSIIEMKRRTTIQGKVTEVTNYYISSLNSSAERIMQTIRSHWKIESMHWVLDVVLKRMRVQCIKVIYLPIWPL